MDGSSYKLNFDPDKKDEIYHLKIAELGCKMFGKVRKIFRKITTFRNQTLQFY
jgi:hypothetical protein